MSIGYLGPSGTFTQQAALQFCEPHEETVAFSTIDDVILAVNAGEIEKGAVPIENSTEGIVNATVDHLIFDCNVFIQEQLVIDIEHNLMVKENNLNHEIIKILSHTQSLAQCRKYLYRHYKGVEILPVSSNAEAARLVQSSEENWAAISPRLAAKTFGLTIIDSSIQDESNNATKFILISKQDSSKPVKNQKTSIAFSTENKPGELYKILDIFSLWDINMTSIVSRPRKGKTGEYVFLIDLDVAQNERDMVDALTMVKRKTNFYKSLGCYGERLAGNV